MIKCTCHNTEMDQQYSGWAQLFLNGVMLNVELIFDEVSKVKFIYYIRYSMFLIKLCCDIHEE